MKKNNAFTFAEVLLSLFVLAVSIYVFSKLQFKSIYRVRKSGEEIERLFFIKKYLYQLYINPYETLASTKKPLKIILQNPKVIITVNKQKIDKKKSTLKNFSKEIDIIWAEGSWESGPDKRLMKMISFIPKQKK